MSHKTDGKRASTAHVERASTTRDERVERTRGNVWRRIALFVLACAYVILWVGGVGHYLFVGAVAAEQSWLASAFLSVAGLIVLLAATSRRAALQLVAVAALGLGFELCGVRYGLPFGLYAYTGVLQPTIFGVPLVMAFAWMSLVAYLKQSLSRLPLKPWVGALIASAWMTTIDLVIDPLAANQLGYWRWVERGSYYGIPSSNFVGWFVCSLSIFLLFRQKWQPNFWHRLTGASIILFFTLVALSFQLYLAALFGFGLCAAELLIHLRRKIAS
ncbi:MAG TPA: carotenoid biosynthesis protein [Pyrinomonadaceae bacterium]|jgi:putative membrane protein